MELLVHLFGSLWGCGTNGETLCHNVVCHDGCHRLCVPHFVMCSLDGYCNLKAVIESRQFCLKCQENDMFDDAGKVQNGAIVDFFVTFVGEVEVR